MPLAHSVRLMAAHRFEDGRQAAPGDYLTCGAAQPSSRLLVVAAKPLAVVATMPPLEAAATMPLAAAVARLLLVAAASNPPQQELHRPGLAAG